MDKRVILTVLPGSFESGFPVTLRIKSKSEAAENGGAGRLPKTDNIMKLFYQWQSAYRKAVMSDSRIKHSPNQLTHISYECLGSELSQGLNKWLNSPDEEWQKIRDSLHYNLNQSDEILFFIQTDNSHLRQLPWHLWDLFSEKYRKSEIALSVPEYQPLKKNPASLDKKVKILAILGHTKGINVAVDKAVIKRLPNADPKFLVETQRQELTNQLWEQEWKIFFFAGHSSSQPDGKTGQIYINPNDSLSLTDLKNGLKSAIERGLQLAIFNSCDGLGLARELADLNIPLIIIMREPVPDLVAQEFLRQFLRAFAQGKSLYLAVREARERLQGLEDEYPCASWLPVICQNPDTVSPTWRDLCGEASSQGTEGSRGQQDDGGRQQNHQTLFGGVSLTKVLILSAIATSLVMGVRYLGWLQTWELECFDHLQRLRPIIPKGRELPDPRLMIVGITEEDLQLRESKGRQGSLSDQALSLLLQRLKNAKARTIGLDIYRDFATSDRQLIKLMSHSKNLFAVCKVSDEKLHTPGISPPPGDEIPKNQVGFSDIFVDRDSVLRRYLLAVKSTSLSACNAPYALSFKLAFHYLNQEKYFLRYKKDKDNKEKELQVGKFILQRLRPHRGSYQKLDGGGYQSLLNYRSFEGSPLNIAKIVSLKQMLDGKVNDDDIRDRIVLIGVTTANLQDYDNTPYSDGQPDQKIPGVVAQAQMVSQLVSAAVEERPLLWFWPWWSDTLWVFVWSLWGGLLAFQVRPPLFLVLAIAASGLGLCGVCLVLLVANGSWVAFLPSALGLASTSIVVIVWRAQIIH